MLDFFPFDRRLLYNELDFKNDSKETAYKKIQDYKHIDKFFAFID